VVVNKCSFELHSWCKSGLLFAEPMIWRDCYFCAFFHLRFPSQRQEAFLYSIYTSEIHLPPFHRLTCANSSLKSLHILLKKSSSTSENKDVADKEPSIPRSCSVALHIVTRCELNDFVRDLNFLKKQGQLLASRLQEWN
jgi:hypothetical protein